MNSSGTLQGKGCNLFAMSFMQGQRMNETKTEQNILLAFYWPISKVKYFSRINISKVKYSTPGQFYLFSFTIWNEPELMNVFKCWAKAIIF